MHIFYRNASYNLNAIQYYPIVNMALSKQGNSKRQKEKTSSAFSHNAKESIKAILADDDEDDRELFKEAIEESGIKVKLEMAEDGMELLKLLKRANSSLPDVIFLDLNMPNKNGKECLSEIRNNEKLCHIPVIIYSTSSSLNDIEETFKQGANLYVSKPSSFQELLRIAPKIFSLNWNIYKPGSSRKNFVYNKNT